MFQKDYILRMIEMIGDLIAALLGLIKKGDLEQAEKILERGYFELLRRDASFFQLIPKEQLTEAKNKLNNSLIYYEKSLVLLDFLEQEDKTWSAKRDERKSLLKERIAVLSEKETPKS